MQYVFSDWPLLLVQSSQIMHVLKHLCNQVSSTHPVCRNVLFLLKCVTYETLENYNSLFRDLPDFRFRPKTERFTKEAVPTMKHWQLFYTASLKLIICLVIY